MQIFSSFLIGFFIFMGTSNAHEKRKHHRHHKHSFVSKKPRMVFHNPVEKEIYYYQHQFLNQNLASWTGAWNYQEAFSNDPHRIRIIRFRINSRAPLKESLEARFEDWGFVGEKTTWEPASITPTHLMLMYHSVLPIYLRPVGKNKIRYVGGSLADLNEHYSDRLMEHLIRN